MRTLANNHYDALLLLRVREAHPGEIPADRAGQTLACGLCEMSPLSGAARPEVFLQGRKYFLSRGFLQVGSETSHLILHRVIFSLAFSVGLAA